MLTTTEQILQFFEDFGKQNPYWVLYQSHDKRDANMRRAMNWETNDYTKAKDLLEKSLKRYEITGGSYHLTLSDKAKDTVPSVCTNIVWLQKGEQPTSSVNGIPYAITQPSAANTNEIIDMRVNNAVLKMELEAEKRERERDKKEAERINGLNTEGGLMGGVFNWLNGLKSHPNFDPNLPFHILGNVVGVPMMQHNPQGLPEHVTKQIGYAPPQPQPTTPQPPPTEQPTAPEQHTPSVLEQKGGYVEINGMLIIESYMLLCDKLGVAPEKRNELLLKLADSNPTVISMLSNHVNTL